MLTIIISGAAVLAAFAWGEIHMARIHREHYENIKRALGTAVAEAE